MRFLIQAGIPQYVRKNVYEICHKREPKIKMPQVFSFNDLQFEFVTWLVACSIAVGVFFLELIWFYGKLGLTSVIGIFYFIRMLKFH
mgnify:FL=1